jgi:lactate dehydrogenase-like 2-hydroxyacid dehydrogenase
VLLPGSTDGQLLRAIEVLAPERNPVIGATERHRWTTLLRMDREDVPAALLGQLEKVVDPIWSTDGSATAAQTSAVKLMVTANAAIDAAYLGRFPQLSAIVTTGTAYDYVDAAECRRRGIKIYNTPGYTGASVAEHALALFLAACRHLIEYDAEARSGASGAEPLGLELEGKTAGIIGLGDIGTRIARLVRAFGMEVCFVNRSVKSLPGAAQVDLDTLLRESDVVFLSLPLTLETERLIGTAQLALMKPTAYLINISSDELIDLLALADALNEGRLGGAGFDVIGSTEPYRNLPQTVLTPTKGWYTAESVHRRAATWIRTVESLITGVDLNRVE